MNDELYIDSVEFYYDSRRPLLTGVFLSCQIGEVVALLGRNGCGKSTLLKIIFGTVKPRLAYMKIKDKVINKGYLTHEVHYLPQESYLPTNIKVSKLIHLMIDDLKKREIFFEDIRLKKILNQKIYSLSGGERRYLEILLLIYQKGSFVFLMSLFQGLSLNMSNLFNN